MSVRKSNDVHIAAYMMVKNEEKRITVTLNSVKEIIKTVVVFDTGSTDTTVEVIRKWCEDNSKTLHLLEGTFVDFSTSRNQGLDFADTIEGIDWILLLDCNDELKSPTELVDTCVRLRGHHSSAVMISQEWLAGSSITKYYNVRVIRPRVGWRYKGVVHEYLKQIPETPDNIFKAYSVVIYQDRNADNDGKTANRFKRDKEMLLAEVERDPTDTRSMYYLGQTCECLDQWEDAIKYYEKRAEMMNGFYEERYTALYHRGRCFERLKRDDTISAYLQAYELDKRCEPLVKIGNIHQDKKDHRSATMFYKEACQISYPDRILFVDKKMYDYERYHRLGISAYYTGEYFLGYLACQKAIENSRRDLDVSNLKFYTEKLRSLDLTKTQWITSLIKARLLLDPRIEYTKLEKWAEREYVRR